MIILCPKCTTKFRLDDSRVTEKGVKVRCAKCKHVFTVQKEGTEEESHETKGTLTDISASSAPNNVAPETTPENKGVTVEAVPSSMFDSDVFEKSPPGSASVDFDSFDTSSVSAPATSFESDELSFSDSWDKPEESVEPAATGKEFDFSNFDFSENESEPAVKNVPAETFPAPAEPPPVAPQNETTHEIDFSNDMFAPVVQPTTETSGEVFSTGSEVAGFTPATLQADQDSTGNSSSLFSLETPDETPAISSEAGGISNDKLERTVQTVAIDSSTKPLDIVFAPLTEKQSYPATEEKPRFAPAVGSADAQQELPPLLIASRRKQSSVFTILISVIAVVVVSVLGYLGFTSFSAPKEAAPPETGVISVRAVKAAFVNNVTAGELLVVSGEALNEYPKARAALLVKVNVFDGSGQSVAMKSAYGGNPLSKEQLESLPLDKIEATMANQFGDSLVNMEVAPGKAIPFVVVLANIPKGANNFSVLSAGSTVATAKQQ